MERTDMIIVRDGAHVGCILRIVLGGRGLHWRFKIIMEKGLVIRRGCFIQESEDDIHLHYDIDKKELGCGAFGKVYLARRKDNPKLLRAVKAVPRRCNRIQLAQQISILKSLDYPNVLKLYEVFTDSHFTYLVTDYFEGGDLFQRIEKEQFGQADARVVFVQALEAVAYLHGQRVMHRDLKPQNLMFLNSKSLSLKLIDFGLACRWEEGKMQRNRPAGSIYYVSPEVLEGQYNQKCDIWSLGVILYILVTGSFPFDAPAESQVGACIRTRKFTTPISNLKISEQLKNLLSRMLQFQKDRPQAKQLFEHPWITSKEQGPLIKLNLGKLGAFAKFSKVKTLAVSYIASQLPQKEIEKLAALFKQIDINHDGFLSVEELRTAFAQQKEKAPLVELSNLLQVIDTDRNGQINYSQFISCCLENSLLFKEENLRAAFKLLDRDQDGRVERAELAELLTETDLQFDPATIEEMMKTCDKNGDGFIDYKEFVESISKR